MKSNLPDSLTNLSDEMWLDTLIKSVTTRVINNVEFPGFPSEELQTQYVGSANEETLRAAFAFYKLVKECAEKFDRPLRQESHFLDFGCGWGRFSHVAAAGGHWHFGRGRSAGAGERGAGGMGRRGVVGCREATAMR